MADTFSSVSGSVVGVGGGGSCLLLVVGRVVGYVHPGRCGICHNRGYAEARGGIYTY